MNPTCDQLCCSMAISKPMYINLQMNVFISKQALGVMCKEQFNYLICNKDNEELPYTNVSASDDIKWKKEETNR